MFSGNPSSQSAQLNQSVNVTLTSPTFTADQDHVPAQSFPPFTPTDIFTHTTDLNPQMEEANPPSEYHYLSKSVTFYPNWHDTCGDHNMFTSICESSYSLPPLSPLNSFEETNAIVFSPPPSPQPQLDLDSQPHAQPQLQPQEQAQPLAYVANSPTPIVDEFDNQVTTPTVETIDAIVLQSPPPPSPQPQPQTEPQPLDSGENSPRLLHSLPIPTVDPFEKKVISPATQTVISPASSLHASVDVATTATTISSVAAPSGRRRRKTRRVTHPAPPPQEIEQLNDVPVPDCSPQDEAITEVQMLNKFLGFGSKHHIFKTSIITVDRKEDVAEKITSFAKEKGSVFVSGAFGFLSVVQLLQQEKTATYKGKLEILKLFGTYFLPKNATQHSTSQLSVTFVGADGEVVGGTVNGRVVAATYVQLIGFTYAPIGLKLRRLKTKRKQRHHRTTTSMKHDSTEEQYEEKKR